MLLTPFTTYLQLANVLDRITFDDLVNFSNDIFKKRIIEGFVGGNVSAQESLDALNMLRDLFPGSACDPNLVEQSKLKPLSGIGRPTMYNFNADVAGNFRLIVR
jgi:secreted Zn-dependent insulinase-like peptidase